LKQLTLIQILEKVEALIDTGNGDTGRLYHILEFLKNNKTLYHSDQVYLENKLNSSFSVKEEPLQENIFLPKIQELIDSGGSDPGRLQHIYEMLEKNRPLYYSDQVYLESKLHPSIHEQSIEQVEFSESKQTREFKPSLLKDILKPETKPNIRGSLPKDWHPDVDSEDLTKISENIKDENKKIEEQKKISHEIDQQRSNLTELVSDRIEYEQKVNQEKSSLESQIKDERFRIETQTKLSKEIIAQKKELGKVKKDRIDVIKKIDSEKTKISKELPHQKRQLAQAQLEQEKIEKQAQNEQAFLAKMTEEQKSRLGGQVKIVHEIKLKQIELEKTKQDYDEIVSQVKKEKMKFAESTKLKKLIKIQEHDLIKAKEERLDLINLISKKKEIIIKKSQDEKERLKSQTELTKQLKKEEMNIESLKKKREKMEQQIKAKNQKLKQEQQKLKKQIVEKNKKLKSFAKKSSLKIRKKSKKSTIKKIKK